MTALSTALRALLPCDAQGSDHAAWARLTDGIEQLTGLDVQQRFATEGIQITLNSAVQFKVDAVSQRPGAVLPAVTLHDKHTAPLIDCNDGSKCHAVPCISAVIVADGGAA